MSDKWEGKKIQGGVRLGPKEYINIQILRMGEDLIKVFWSTPNKILSLFCACE